jgi:hypothetical protein
MLRILIIILLLTRTANALTIGTGFTYTKNKQVVSQQYKPTFTIGGSWEYKKINLAINTNRFAVRSNDLVLKSGLKVKQTVRFDGLQLGYRINRFIPALFLANVKIEKKFLNQKTTNNLLVSGFSVNYLLTKDLSFGFGGTTKNEEGQSFFTNITYRL